VGVFFIAQVIIIITNFSFFAVTKGWMAITQAALYGAKTLPGMWRVYV
jgi:hypothetical protein